MRVLLAEDDPHISMITQICLEKIGGHEVITRENGDAALETALREPFDLILLDGMMPKKSGVEVAVALKQAGVIGTPIVFLSAKSDEKDINQFLSLGAGYIAKPFDPQTICTRIDVILQGLKGASGQ